MIKFSQYFDDEFFTMIIDYIVFKFVLQIKITNRKSICFNEWFMYLSIYLSKMKIIHRAKKNHNNANDFFKIFIEIEIYYVDVYFIVVLNVNQDFQIIIKKTLSSNSHFERIYDKIRAQIKKTKKNENDSQTIYQLYKLNQNIEFFYFVNKSNSNRVCISKSFYKNVFKFTHDNHAHDDIEKSLNRLRQFVYMSKMKNRLKKYIDECSTCQLFKSFKQLFYEQLHSIEISKEFFFELSMNFVVELSMTSKNYNALVIVICRYFKYVRLISDKKNWTTKRWTQKYYKKIYRTWNLFVRIVTNRNFKFINDFWRILFEKTMSNWISSRFIIFRSINKSKKQIKSSKRFFAAY